MLSLALAVVAIALPDSLNPSLIAGELVVAGGRHPGARAVAFTVAAWAVTFAVGLALALGLGDLIVSLLPKPGARLKYSLIIFAVSANLAPADWKFPLVMAWAIAGLVLAFLAVILARRGSKSGQDAS